MFDLPLNERRMLSSNGVPARGVGACVFLKAVGQVRGAAGLSMVSVVRSATLAAAM